MEHRDLVLPTEKMLTYGSYLKVKELLELQSPVSEPAEKDEMLFIVIHQVYELWFKQILHDISFGAAYLEQGKIMPFLRELKRVNTIMRTLIQQVEILETMTPNDFNAFRDRLNPASGFQSWQFRYLEFFLGSRDREYLKFYRTQPEVEATLAAVLEKPSLYDLFLRMLNKKGLTIPDAVLKKNVAEAHVANDDLETVFLQVYANPDKNYEVYLALESMMDLDESILLWRYRHVAMVQRMIGTRRGTGGSSGVNYLTQTLSKRFFPEIWSVRSLMGKSYTSVRDADSIQLKN